MLPGFRFLLSAIALSISILVLGLGAAALLRTAHEEFASNPSWRVAPEAPMITQHSEPAKPVLAMLQVDPPHPEPAPDAGHVGALDQQDTASLVEATKAEAAPSPVPVPSEATSAPVMASDAPSNPEDIKVAAADAAWAGDTQPTAIEAAAPEIPKPETMIAETAKLELTKAEVAVAPAKLEFAKAELAVPDAPKVEIAAPQVSRAEPAISAPRPPFDPATNPAATRIATLGGPAVTIEEAAPKKPDNDKAERSAKAERQAEARARAHRRAALRARLARQQAAVQQAAQQAADPFGVTATVTPASSRTQTR